MILYFSATGNCKYVAKRISEATADQMVAMTDCMNEASYDFTLEEGEPIGIIIPTYGMGLPTIVTECLSKLNLKMKGEHYVYFVATYGTTPGQTGYFANEIMQDKGMTIDAYFSVKMPDTWTPIFDLSKKEKVDRINEKAEVQISEIIVHIKQGAKGDFMRHKMPHLVVKRYFPVYLKKMRNTKHFHVEDSCIGCSLCAKKCPVAAIEMQDGKPVWVKEQCVMCLGCLHRCPKFAIQYGNKTQKHGQYTNPNVKL